MQPERIISEGSAVQKHLGFVVEMYADRCETVLHIQPHHRNRNGHLHGGLCSLMLDTTCGYAASRALSADGAATVVTVSLTTNFLNIAKGQRVRAIGRVTKQGRSMLFAHGEVLDESGTVLVSGTAVFKAMPGMNA